MLLSRVLSFVFIRFVSGCCYYGADCQEYQARGHTTSGVYHVTPQCTNTGYDVYCDMTTDGGGWLVFQRRLDGSLDFYRDWREYEQGFGDNNSQEYWLGLRPLKIILSQGFYELRIDMTDFEGNSTYAKYDTFNIGDFTENYRLKVKGYIGTAGDSFSYHNGYMFSTKDKDNDNYAETNCAQDSKGAWWYDSCIHSNLNGQYLNGSHTKPGEGVNWLDWRGETYSLKTTDMKIRRV